MSKLVQSRIIGIELAHASLQVDHLSEIAVSRLIPVKEGKYRLGLVNILGI
jgi:hypothetical protein